MPQATRLAAASAYGADQQRPGSAACGLKVRQSGRPRGTHRLQLRDGVVSLEGVRAKRAARGGLNERLSVCAWPERKALCAGEADLGLRRASADDVSQA